MGVVRIWARERRPLRQHHEEDDCGGEQIHTLSSVRLAKVDFRGHVGGGTKLGGQESTAISTFGWCSKSKISNLQIEFWVKHDILWFQIPVAGPSIVHVVKRSH